MPLVDAYFFVIPGWSAGPGPEPMNTGHSQVGGGLCAWVSGSRTAPAPRNDEYFRFADTLIGRRLMPRPRAPERRERGQRRAGPRRARRAATSADGRARDR